MVETSITVRLLFWYHIDPRLWYKSICGKRSKHISDSESTV